MDPTIIRILDITAAVVGVAYLWWEYRASIWVWVAGIVMPAIDIALYWEKGLYGDFALAIYYLLAAVYGLLAWKYFKGRSEGVKERPIVHCPSRSIVPLAVAFLALWAGMYFFLDLCTNSTVPVLDSLTNALSIIGLYMLAQKHLEQWIVWLVVDIIYVGLYAYKDLPGKSTLYILYTAFAVVGYLHWNKKMLDMQVLTD